MTDFFETAERAPWVEGIPSDVELKSPFTGLENLTDAFAFLASTRGFKLVFGEPSLSANARVCRWMFSFHRLNTLPPASI